MPSSPPNFSFSNLLKTPAAISRCPGASHRRVDLERRKSSQTQTQIEGETGSTVIDPPGTSPPETDCLGTVPVERNLTPAPLPVWPEEPGLDNPAFEESSAADCMCTSPLPVSFRLPCLSSTALLTSCLNSCTGVLFVYHTIHPLHLQLWLAAV